MAKDFQINNTPKPPISNPKYIVKGIATKVLSTEIYRAGVEAANLRGGGVERDKPLYKSKLGTGVMADITFPAFDYTIDDVTFSVPEVKLYTMLLVVDSGKNIVKTPIQGLNGTIKEYISDADDSVTMKGKIVGRNGVHPFEEVKALHKLLKAPVAVKVISKWLQNLDIDTLVVESFNVPQEEGRYSYQSFEITFSTDFPIELNIVSASNTNA